MMSSYSMDPKQETWTSGRAAASNVASTGPLSGNYAGLIDDVRVYNPGGGGAAAVQPGLIGHWNR
jgi:hypothetical protein